MFSAKSWRLLLSLFLGILSFVSFVTFVSAPSLASPVEKKAGQWKTWVISSGREIQVAKPPGYGVSEKELDTVKEAVAKRTSQEADAAKYWDTGAPSDRWFEVAKAELKAHSLPPPLASRALALLGASIYDTTVSTWYWKYHFNRRRPMKEDPNLNLGVRDRDLPSYPSEHAATAAAAAEILSYLFPQDAMKLAQMAEEEGASRINAGANFPSDVTAGASLGKAVADAVISVARSDRSDAAFTGSFPPAPGVWSGTNPTTPLAGTWKTWVLTNGSEFQSAAPPAFDSAEEAAQVAAVKNVVRTPEILETVRFWQPGFIVPWLDVTSAKIAEYHLDENAPRAARVYALETIAMHDSVIARFDSAYAYLVMRPPQVSSDIVPVYPSPSNPSYPAAHAVGSMAAATVLSYLFPKDGAYFQAKAIEAGQSTFYAGIHFQMDEDAGNIMGQKVGSKIVKRAKYDGAM